MSFFLVLSLYLKEYDVGREVLRIYNELIELFIVEFFFYFY